MGGGVSVGRALAPRAGAGSPYVLTVGRYTHVVLQPCVPMRDGGAGDQRPLPLTDSPVPLTVWRHRTV